MFHGYGIFLMMNDSCYVFINFISRKENGVKEKPTGRVFTNSKRRLYMMEILLMDNLMVLAYSMMALINTEEILV